jgi:uncharacterized DUF497 family protein
MRFEWDPVKDRANRRKHGLSFVDASRLFTEGLDILEVYDEEHSVHEDRFVAIGQIERGIIVVVYTERQDDVIRILSARMATARERRRLEESWRGRDEQ